jgi:hypothetical protein
MIGQADARKSQIKEKYYEDICQAAKVLVQNMKLAIQVFETASNEARLEYDQDVQKYKLGWSDTGLEPKMGPKGKRQ